MQEPTTYYEMLIRFSVDRKQGFPLLTGMNFLPRTVVMPNNFESDLEALTKLQEDRHWNLSIPFRRYLKRGYTLVVTDTDQRIEWVSSGFEQMTGYTAQEAQGRRPSFLQGEKTNVWIRQEIKKRLSAVKPVEASIINYRKDGHAYICAVKIIPVYSHTRKLVNFLALEREEFTDVGIPL